MIEIKTDSITHNELVALHKIICILHKTDYGLSIDTGDGYIIAKLTEQ